MRVTNEQRAYVLWRELSEIRDTTIDPAIYRAADKAALLASRAVGDYNTAKGFDRLTGGGSSKAWGYRTKARRAFNRAQAARRDLSAGCNYPLRASAGEPSLANILFLIEIADATIFPARMIDHDQALPCQTGGWIVLHTPSFGPYWGLTAEGTAILAVHRKIVEGYRLSAGTEG